jgi:type IV pilus assembly protein PilE
MIERSFSSMHALSRTNSWRGRSAGITLIELMIVIVIVAVLAGMATSTYRKYLMRTNRTEAKTALLRVQVAQEKFFLQNNRYAKTAAEMTAAPPAGLGVPAVGNYYSIDFSAAADSTYTARATAINGQTGDDAACRTLTIDDSGKKTPDDSTGCWK